MPRRGAWYILELTLIILESDRPSRRSDHPTAPRPARNKVRRTRLAADKQTCKSSARFDHSYLDRVGFDQLRGRALRFS